jgi:hypothetical protein
VSNGPEERWVKVMVHCTPTATPGLVVTREVGGRGWSLTHDPSGRSVANFNAKEDAVRAGDALSGLADWTEETPSADGAAVGPILKALGGRRESD